MGSAETFKYREAFEGSQGVLPGEVAPRLVLIHDFPAGPDGLTSPRPGGGLGLSEIERYFSDGNPDYGVDFAEVFARQSFGGATPGAIDVYRLTRSDAVAASVVLDDQNPDGLAVKKIGTFTAVGSGDAYNKTITLTVTEIIASGHPAGANTPVFTVTVPAPNADGDDEVFNRIVFTQEDGKGSSAYHRTRDAAAISDMSMVVNFAYDPEAVDADYSFFTKGDVINLALAGGTDGVTALADADWQGAIDEIGDMPFRWAVVPNPPSAIVRGNLHSTVQSMPFGFSAFVQMYGETIADFLTARDALGTEADDGRTAAFFGWGPHPAIQGREVPCAAAYLGQYSARINGGGLGGEYGVGNRGLGFTGIAAGDQLSQADQKSAAAANVNYLKQLFDGSFGVHGSWTLDSQLDRMGDISVRIIWNDIIRRLALQFTPLAHNRGATVLTQRRIKNLGDMAIRPYISRGFVKVASTGVVSMEEAASRFPGLGFPSTPGWVVYLAMLRLFPTLQGVEAYLTDADIQGLTSLTGGGDSEAGGEGEGGEA